MRLSGNYLERLLINVIPWTLVASIIIFLAKGGVEGTIVTFIISTMAFWILDTLIIFFKFKNPRSLRFSNGLFWGNEPLSTNDIVEVMPITDKRFRWSFQMIEFLLKDGRRFMVIDKPQTVIQDLLNKPSITLKRLTDQYPELKSKVKHRKII